MRTPPHKTDYRPQPNGRGGRPAALVILLLCVVGYPLRAQQPTEPGVLATLGVLPERVYAGQTFELVLTIRAQGITLGKNFNLDGINLGDAVSLGAFQELSPTREGDGNQLVEIHRFRSIAQAIRPGLFNLASTLRYQQLTHERTFFGTTTFQTTRSITVVPLALTIAPLPPEGRPADFSGAVGRFTFTATATPQDAAVGDLVTMTLTISGDGTLDGLACPPLSPNPHFKTYPPRLSATPEAGTLRFEQIVIPQSTNAVVTPDSHFSFFDPLDGAYRTLSAGALPIHFHSREAAPAFTPYRPDTTNTQLTISAPIISSNGLPSTPPPATAIGAWRAATQSCTVLREVTARLAPSDSARASGTVSSGDQVQVTETWGTWLCVSRGSRRGWIPADAVSR